MNKKHFVLTVVSCLLTMALAMGISYGAYVKMLLPHNLNTGYQHAIEKIGLELEKLVDPSNESERPDLMIADKYYNLVEVENPVLDNMTPVDEESDL